MTDGKRRNHSETASLFAGEEASGIEDEKARLAFFLGKILKTQFN